MITPTHILCHYAEIGLKGQNRGYFERKLKDNIKLQAKTFFPGSIGKIDRLQGRFLIPISEQGLNNLSRLITIFQSIPGIAWFAPVKKIEPDLEVMKSEALGALENESFDSFRVTARKTYSPFPLSKMEIHTTIGDVLCSHYGKKVSLSDPDINCHIDLLYSSCYIYLKKIQGIGGLPIGSASPVAVMLSGGIDSPVAAYYTMKRGTRAVFVHFHSVPLVSPASVDKVKRTVEILRKYQPKATLYLVEFASIQNEIFAHCDPRYLVLLYRRFMVRISTKIGTLAHAKALVTGESIGQVASQTIENITVVEQASSIPILRPVIGFDKHEIIDIAKSIGTYEVSIEPHQDCCTLYVPAHPATKARLIDIEKEESKLEVDHLVEKAVDTVEIVKY